MPRRWFDEAAVAEKPSTDERTGTRGCGEVPDTKGNEVQRVLRWCKVLVKKKWLVKKKVAGVVKRVTKHSEFCGGVRCYLYLPACGASAHLKRRRRRRGDARRSSREGSYSSWCTLILLKDREKQSRHRHDDCRHFPKSNFGLELKRRWEVCVSTLDVCYVRLPRTTTILP